MPHKVVVFDAFRYAKRGIKTARPLNAEVYLSQNIVTFFSFDQEYLRLLETNDPVTWSHFNSYFARSLRPKLRSWLTTAEDLADVLQETFTRVLIGIRGGLIRQPSALGAYVHSTCRHVLLEFVRSRERYQHVDVDSIELIDFDSDVEQGLFREERQQLVETVLQQMPRRERALIRACILEDQDKDQVCARFAVDREYLRVLLHRARESFRKEWAALDGRMSKTRAGAKQPI